MAKEEFTVRITRKGEIIVETEGLPPRRVKDLIKYLEETIGPARLIESDSPDASGAVELEESAGREEEEEEREEQEHDAERLRLRNEE